MKYLILPFVIFLYHSGIAQKRVTYKFVAEKRTNFDSVTGFYPEAPYEFKYTRIFLGDSSFKEYGLFSTDVANTTSWFKIKNGNWYFRNKKKWKPFYLLDMPTEPVIQISGNYYKFKIEGNATLDGHKCIIYQSRSIDADVSSNINYWFNPTLGIVKIETSEVKLIRACVQ